MAARQTATRRWLAIHSRCATALWMASSAIMKPAAGAVIWFIGRCGPGRRANARCRCPEQRIRPAAVFLLQAGCAVDLVFSTQALQAQCGPFW